MSEPDVYKGADGVTLARATIDRLASLHISTAPTHYELWATHLAGVRPALSEEITALLESGVPADAFSAELFERHFGNTRLSVELIEASETISRELAGVAASLRSAGDNTGAYSGALKAAALSFERGIDAAGFRALMNTLAVATRDMAVRNRELSDQMAASSRQVESLQSTLQSVRVEALTDGLTGLANRKYFDETLLRNLERAPGDVCLLMCDIDHFKRFNDSYGHVVGDNVIRFIAQVLRAAAGGDYIAARYGGEEFALVMPRTVLSKATAVGESLNAAVKAKRLTRRSSGESLGVVTISVGVARHRAGESANALIARADACLYQSKHAGRDRVTAQDVFVAANAA